MDESLMEQRRVSEEGFRVVKLCLRGRMCRLLSLLRDRIKSFKYLKQEYRAYQGFIYSLTIVESLILAQDERWRRA